MQLTRRRRLRHRRCRRHWQLIGGWCRRRKPRFNSVHRPRIAPLLGHSCVALRKYGRPGHETCSARSVQAPACRRARGRPTAVARSIPRQEITLRPFQQRKQSKNWIEPVCRLVVAGFIVSFVLKWLFRNFQPLLRKITSRSGPFPQNAM